MRKRVKNKILVTGSNGRFAAVMKKKYIKNKKYIFLDKNKLNILSKSSIRENLIKYKPKMVIHLAALSRPMHLHYKNIQKSISINIIGTSNLVIECSKLNIKIVHFSTQYVYPGIKGNYSENSPLLPMNNYAWSKLGAECAVQIYNNSLILRVAMLERPWTYSYAYKNVKSNYLYHDEVVKLLPKLLSKKGIINIGSATNSIIKFAKRTKKNVKTTTFFQKSTEPKTPINSSMNIIKLKKIIKN